MSRRSGARCILQVARERRLSVYPGEFGMEQDICDVTLWLKEKFRETALLLWIGQHYLQRDHEVAEVTVITKPRRSHSLTPAAREAFLALGYAIENTGADTFGYPFCDCDHSRHEALQAFARIEAALQKVAIAVNLQPYFHPRAARAALFHVYGRTEQPLDAWAREKTYPMTASRPLLARPAHHCFTEPHREY